MTNAFFLLGGGQESVLEIYKVFSQIISYLMGKKIIRPSFMNQQF